jgi:hypothetical protein
VRRTFVEVVSCDAPYYLRATTLFGLLAGSQCVK